MTFQKILSGILLILSMVGFADATYLTVKHYTNDSIFCAPAVGDVVGGCDKVTDSLYAMVYSVPVALLGALYYLTVFILSCVYWLQQKKNLLVTILAITTLGVLASAWFVYVQLFILHAICFFCMVSAVCTLILFSVALGTMMMRPTTV